MSGSKAFGCLTVVLFALAVGGCSRSERQPTDSGDDTVAGRDVATIRGSETYNEYNARRDALDTGRYSGDDECTEDCSGHDAGRRWAEAHDITDPDDCGGKSWSFEEGCRSYAEEQTDGGDDDDDRDKSGDSDDSN